MVQLSAVSQYKRTESLKFSSVDALECVMVNETRVWGVTTSFNLSLKIRPLNQRQ